MKLTLQPMTQMFSTLDLSPVEVCIDVLDRIDRHNGKINAFTETLREGALAAANASEARWKAGLPLSRIDGVPCTVKDLLLSTRWAAKYGSLMFGSESVAAFDAPVVARLKEAGAVIVGVTTSPEMGWKAVTDSPRFGVTRNPWDLSRTPGGSSGGASAAAATDLGVLHVGTDGGGSIRIPASFCGIVGHKPSFGRVPAYPISPFGTVAHVGPMARSVYDAAAMLSVIARPDSRDWYSLQYDGAPYEERLSVELKGRRIAYSATLGRIDVDPEVRKAFFVAVNAFKDLGADLIEIDPPIGDCQTIFHAHWFAGAAFRLRDLAPDQRGKVDPGLLQVAEQGGRYSLKDFQAAAQARAELGARMRVFHEQYDLLLTPTTAMPAFAAGQEVPNPEKGGRWTDWAGFSYPFNLTQQPACSVPCGFTKAGLPIGLQIVGSNFADLAVLQAAHAYEQTQQWSAARPLSFE
ncbi:Amidase [Paraburkholderia piptadeniae]|uniref:Amidase n=1 Tax=Paraburkholderia piptadeniae TaxID=1701573 RepID=A0A1N7RVC6_9BURK|nr:amidase [Paraburkholderia piptadeniae]SIT39071.1 Amidase [Paraburkholderia piptadeniae]